jgi:putative cardiolipin synthase
VARGWLLGLALLLCGCATLPREVARTPSYAIGNTNDTRLGLLLQPRLQEHAGASGFNPLADGVDALLARIVLAELAQRSLDVQYYIWHDDLTGRHFAQALLRAADRGVRVRILLDDVGVNARDEVLLSLDAHPNIEIRLFNPIASRSFRNVSALNDFSRVNRRMHNKAFVADNQAAILGGRNIGDEYFDASGEVAFRDLDVLTVGASVPEVSHAFDTFWNSEVAYPVSSLSELKDGASGLSQLRAMLAAFIEAEKGSPYIGTTRQALFDDMTAGRYRFSWGKAHLLYDAPDKVLHPPERVEGTLLPQFGPLGLQARQSLLIVSPYFVPGENGVRWLADQVRRGVRVTVLTNSLAATDVSAVHAGYQRYRRELLEAGVRLYEIKADAPAQELRKKQVGGSRASLHAKTFIFDRRAVFIGSMNLDPRSIQLNTEIGVLCESAELASQLAHGVESKLDRLAYRVELESNAEGGTRIVWRESLPAGAVSHASEPEASVWRRFGVWFMGLLPIEGQL